MDKSKIHILLTELMGNQKNTENMFSDKEMLMWSLMKRGDRLQRFGHSREATVIGLTIKFIPTDQCLRNLVSLNRELNEILREEVLKQTLMRSDLHEVQEKRKDIWLQILRIDPLDTQKQYE